MPCASCASSVIRNLLEPILEQFKLEESHPCICSISTELVTSCSPRTHFFHSTGQSATKWNGMQGSRDSFFNTELHLT